MLTEEQKNEWFGTGSRWPDVVVPFVMEPVFSEYCSTKLQSGMGRGGKLDSLSTALSPACTGGWVGQVMEIITSVLH